MGASLETGDIEDVNGTACIRCPWHGRRIALATGCEARGSDKPVQRTHAVRVVDGYIWVEVFEEGQGAACASDRFSCTHSTTASPSGSPLPAAAPAMSRVLMPFAGDLPLPPPPPPLCAASPSAAVLSPVAQGNGLLGAGFRARRVSAACEAVAVKPTVPRVLFTDAVDELAARANAALHRAGGSWGSALQAQEMDMEMNG